jgi:hypothetical protein
MIAIAIFVCFVIIGDVIAVLIASMFEPISKNVSLLVFLGLFVSVFCVAWVLAVYVTERLFVPREANTRR